MTDRTRSVGEYCRDNPVFTGKVSGKAATRELPLSTGWAWKPDPITAAALKRGTRKMKAFRETEHERIMNGDTTMATSKNASKKGARKVSKKGAAKKTGTKRPAKKVSSKKGTNLIPLKKILPEGMDAKIARRKLRAADIAVGHAAQGRWEFTAVQAKKAKAVLTA